MTINQSTDRAAINWNTFNIGTGNTVQFVQPNSNSITLNRVVGSMPSNIQGALLANGQIIIQNANGVLFSSGSVINVNSLLVTTKNVNVDQFMAGNSFDLNATGTNAGIINDGSITAAGYVTLIGDQVRNSGDISAKQVVLAAGDSATVALDNGQGISVTLTNSTANALVENSGKIVAGNDGSVLLTAQGKDTLLDTVINLSGVVKAGTIVADAGVTGDVVVTGDLDASNQNGQGGTVVFSGNRVGLFNDATVNVSGDAGGGLVIIGGDNLNKVPGSSAAGLIDKVAFADYTQIDSGVKIDAGSTNGDGGFVETSGADLSVQGIISASAPNGKSGLWLIDPTNVFIVLPAGDTPASYTSPTDFTSTATGAGNTNIGADVISAALTNTDVTITTANPAGTAVGNINQTAGADITGNHNLTLLADTSIVLNGNITLSGSTLNLTADTQNAGTGSVVAVAGTTIDLNGGNLTISGNSSAVPGNGVSLSGTIKNIGIGTIEGSGSGTGYGIALNPSASLSLDSGSDVTMTASSTGTAFYLAGALNVDGGTLVIDAVRNGIGGSANAFAEDTSGKIVVTHGGDISITGTSSGTSTAVSFQGLVSIDGANSHIQASGTGQGNALGFGGPSTLVVTNGASADFYGTNTNVSSAATALFVSGAVSSDGNGSVINFTGNAAGGGAGVSVGSVGDILASNGGAINVDGTSNTGPGFFMSAATSSMEASGTDANGIPSTIKVIGTSNTGDGALVNGTAASSNGGVLSIAGNSTDLGSTGAGVNITGNGVVTANSGGDVIISGMATNGTGVNNDGSITANGAGSTVTSTGTSTNGVGAVNNGTVTATNQGVATFAGTSKTNTGLLNTDNGTISSDSGGTTTGSGTSDTGNGTVNDGIVTSNGTGSNTILNGSSNTTYSVYNTNTIDETNNGSTTVNLNGKGKPASFGVEPGVGLVGTGVSVNTPKASSGGSGGGGGGSNGVGIVAILGAIGYAIFESSTAAASDSPQAMTEEDGKVADATLDEVRVNAEGTEAVVKVRTAHGVAERKLALKDSGDGVRHFALNDAGTNTELSFNPQTREYFYRESGATKNLKAHGWLKEVVASR